MSIRREWVACYSGARNKADESKICFSFFLFLRNSQKNDFDEKQSVEYNDASVRKPHDYKYLIIIFSDRWTDYYILTDLIVTCAEWNVKSAKGTRANTFRVF